jgi:hypothetical protein
MNFLFAVGVPLKACTLFSIDLILRRARRQHRNRAEDQDDVNGANFASAERYHTNNCRRKGTAWIS